MDDYINANLKPLKTNPRNYIHKLYLFNYNFLFISNVEKDCAA